MVTVDDGEIARAWEFLESHVLAWRAEWKAGMLEHARIVRDTALFLGRIYPVREEIDLGIVELGAILHDVGRCRAKRTVEHGIASGAMIREARFPEAVARIGERHMGVGIDRLEARRLGLPDQDFLPQTVEERIVCYADNLLCYLPGESRHELQDTAAAIARFTAELGEEYGRRTGAFMLGVEQEIGPEGMGRFRQYVVQVNGEFLRESEEKKMKKCIFCDIADGKGEVTLVYEDDHCVAFYDINPQAPTHILVIPRVHLDSLNAIDAGPHGLANHLLTAVGKIADRLGLASDGYRTVINTGPNGGQTVFHLHVHLLGGRAMHWPPG